MLLPEGSRKPDRSVGPLFGRLGELDSPSLEFLVGRLAVLGGEEDGAGEALASRS